jgi:hypothetical protein
MMPVDQFVRSVCMALNDPDRRYYNVVLDSMGRGYRDLSLHNMPSYKTIDVDLNQLGMIDWPSECVLPLSLGIGRNGILVPLSEDRTLSDRNVYQENGWGAFVQGSNVLQWYPNYSGVWNTVGELYGIQSPQNPLGSYKNFKDIRQTVINCTLQPTDKIIFCFKYDATHDGLQYLPTEIEMALRQYVFWEFYFQKDKGLSDRAWDKYKKFATRAQNLYNDASDNDWGDILTSNEKSSPK